MKSSLVRTICLSILFSFWGSILSLYGVALAQETRQQESRPVITMTEEEVQRLLQRKPKVVSQDVKEQVKDLLQKSLAHREQIKSGQMVITEHTKNLGNARGEVKREIAIAFDEQRRRVDRHNDFPPNTSYDEVGCIGCYKKDNRLALSYNGILNKDEFRKTSIQIYDSMKLVENELTESWAHDFGFMPEYLAFFGFVCFPTKETFEERKSYLFRNTINLLDTGVTDVTITEEEYKGVLCKKIVFNSEFFNFEGGEDIKRLNTLWIAEGQGYALHKHVYESDSYDELFEVDVALDEESGIWFPSAWHYERNNDGKPFKWQTGSVKDVVLNKPIPEELFDMHDIKIIPAGVQVSWFADIVPPPHGAKRSGELIWDGNDIITRGMYNENLVKQAAAASKSKEFKAAILLSVLTVCVVYGILAWIWYLHIKRQSNSPDGKMLTDQHTEPEA